MGTNTEREHHRKSFLCMIINDYTRHTWEWLIAKKRKFFVCFLKVKSLVERETCKKIKWLRSNGGKTYFSDQFSSYLQSQGIRREAKKNGMAERNNQTIEEVARAMLEEKHMPKFYWAKRSEQPSTSRIGHLSMEECRHMSCNSESSRTWHTWGFSVASHMCMCRGRSRGSWTPKPRSVSWSATRRTKGL